MPSPTADPAPAAAEHLAVNLRRQRGLRALTQAQLARLAGVPRSTLATLEVGGGNPTLAVLVRLAQALQLTLEELLAPPRARFRVYRRGELPIEARGHDGRVTVSKLLPDPIPLTEIDRVAVQPQGRLKGVPHAAGTREYLYCERGQLVLWAAGERVVLQPGDLVAFPGAQNHAYGCEGDAPAVGFSVVVRVGPGA